MYAQTVMTSEFPYVNPFYKCTFVNNHIYIMTFTAIAPIMGFHLLCLSFYNKKWILNILHLKQKWMRMSVKKNSRCIFKAFQALTNYT
jgi:hypothetical protein